MAQTAGKHFKGRRRTTLPLLGNFPPEFWKKVASYEQPSYEQLPESTFSAGEKG